MAAEEAEEEAAALWVAAALRVVVSALRVEPARLTLASTAREAACNLPKALVCTLLLQPTAPRAAELPTNGMQLTIRTL